jgi:serine/threonine-protein kinase
MRKNYLQKSVLAAITVFSLLSGVTQSANAQSRNVFGAISYSPSTQTYSSALASSKQAAINGALRNCVRDSQAQDCTVPLWFRNAWGALAVGADGSYGTGWGTSQALAERFAVSTCQRYGGRSCQVIFIRQAR